MTTNTWIPVQQQVPPAGERVLVHCAMWQKYANGQLFMAEYTDYAEWVLVCSGCEMYLKSVTHWMPLPEPPGEPKDYEDALRGVFEEALSLYKEDAAHSSVKWDAWHTTYKMRDFVAMLEACFTYDRCILPNKVLQKKVCLNLALMALRWAVEECQNGDNVR